MQSLSVMRGKKIDISEYINLKAFEIFSEWIRGYTFIWNCKVAESKKNYEEYLQEKQNNPDAQRKKVDQKYAQFLTEENKWLENIPPIIKRNSCSKFYESFNAFIKGVRKVPTFKGMYSRKNCSITSELFDVIILESNKIIFSFKESAKKKAAAADPFFTITLPIIDGLEEISKMVWITKRNNRIWLSFSYKKKLCNIKTNEEILGEFKDNYSCDNLEKNSIVGVKLDTENIVTLSTGKVLGYTDEEKKQMIKIEKNRLKYQRRLTKMYKMAKKRGGNPGKNYDKVKKKLNTRYARLAYIRDNMAHRVSKRLATIKGNNIIVAEKKVIKKLTLTGRSKKKRKINRKILDASWGKIIQYSTYKLQERNKLLVLRDINIGINEFDINEKAIYDESHKIACSLKSAIESSVLDGSFTFTTKKVKRISVRKKAARAAVSVCGDNISPTL